MDGLRGRIRQAVSKRRHSSTPASQVDPARVRVDGRWPTPIVAVIVGVFQVIGSYGAASRGDADGWGRWHDEGAAAPPPSTDTKLDWLAFLLLTLGPAMLIVRRRYPVATLVVAVGASVSYLLLEYPRGPFVAAAVIAVLGAIVRGHRIAAWIAVWTAYAVVFGLAPLLTDQSAPSLDEATLFAAAYAVVLLVGELFRLRRVRVAESAWTKEVDEERRLGEERLRIARELHDVVAHNISLINVQAGVALHLLDAQPEQARGALTAIKGASKEALVELRSILGVLRQVDEAESRHSAPTVGELENLAERFRTAGISVDVSVEGNRDEVPRAVDLAAYRIVQEALTNVLRHAGRPSNAEVRLRYEDEALVVEVDDDGRGDPVSSAELGTGSGIIGMRERVAGLGGELRVGPREAGGFGVRAVLPYAAGGLRRADD